MIRLVKLHTVSKKITANGQGLLAGLEFIARPPGTAAE
jgi:hypothetical protein